MWAVLLHQQTISWFWKTAGTEWTPRRDFLTRTYLGIIGEFSAPTISSLSNARDFLMLISMPSPWSQPLSSLSHINQRAVCIHTKWALHPAFDMNATFITYSDFFLNNPTTRSQLLKSGLNSSKVWKIMSSAGNDSHQEEGHSLISQLSDQLWF